jgi:hypothetical protein
MHPHTDEWFLLADKFSTKTFDFVVNVIENDVKLFPEDYHVIDVNVGGNLLVLLFLETLLIPYYLGS